MMKKEVIAFIIFFLAIIGILFMIYSNKKTSYSDFSIYFFNAGKADAFLIQNNDYTVMIDTGEEDLSNEILTYFKNYNIEHLDYLIITHFDKDHVGSASTILNSISVDHVLQSNVPKESDVYTNYLSALESCGITPETISGDKNITLGDMEIVVNGPDVIYDKNESNNSSLIVSLTYKNTSYLFMGDAENARIKDFVSTNNNTYDFIKIPYHGNYLKRLESLLSSVNPKYAVITASNEEGAETDTLSLLDNLKIKYYITRDGGVLLTSDGNSITMKQ